MNTDKKNTINKCPEFDDISAWYDKELHDDVLDQHINNCENCQNIISDFESYNKCISENLIIDEHIIQRLKKNCISELTQNHDKNKIVLFPVWAKIAACFLLFGIFITLRQNLQSTKIVQADKTLIGEIKPTQDPLSNFEVAKNIPETTENSSMHKISPEKTNFSSQKLTHTITPESASTGFKDKHSETLANSKENIHQQRLDVADISLVGFGLSQSELNPRNRNTKMNINKDNEISEYVHHVWVVENPASPLESLKTLLPNHQSMLEKLINQEQNRYHLQFKIIGNNLINLVNHFDQMGFKLLSPGAPQPGISDNSKSTDKLIRYDVDFVKE